MAALINKMIRKMHIIRKKSYQLFLKVLLENGKLPFFLQV